MSSSDHYNILQTLTGHTSDITCCDFALNSTLVTGSSDKTIRIWDWKSGSGYVERSSSPLRGHKYQVTCVRVSPQGSMFASSSIDGTAILWNIDNCLKLFTMCQVNGDAIRVCRFSPDSVILVTAGDNGAVCIWDLVRRSLVKTLFEHEGTTHALAFTPDSEYLLTACSLEMIKIWHVQDVMDRTSDFCRPIAKLDNAHDMGVSCMDISRHVQFDENDPLVRKYKLATCGNTNEIKIWSITSKSKFKHNPSSNEVSIALVDSFHGHNSSVTCIRYSHNSNYLVSSSLDKLVKIWDNLGSCVTTLEGHNRYVNCIAISKNANLVASGSNDRVIMIWDIMGNLTLDSELDELNVSTLHVNRIPEIQLLDNVDIVESTVTLFEKMDDVAEGAVNSCCFYGKNILATGSGDKLIRIFKVVGENDTLEEFDFSPIEGHTYAVNHVEFSRNGSYIVSCSLDGYTKVWNAKTGEKYISLPENGMSIKVCRFSSDDQYLITAGDDEKAILWDIHTKEKIVSLDGHLDSISSACFSPDGKIIVTASVNSDFRLWSMQDYNCIYVKEDAHHYGIQSCDMSQNLSPFPNGLIDIQYYLLATCGNDSFVNVWRISVPKHQIDDLSNIEVKLWRRLQGHGGHVVCVRFSQAVSEFICSTATDRQARIWTVYSSDCLFVLDHDSIVTSCSFNIDCSFIATGCQDKSLWIWKLPQQLIFQTTVASKIQSRSEQVLNWSNADVVKWLEDIDMQDIIETVRNSSLDGYQLLTLPDEHIFNLIKLDTEWRKKFQKEIKWLKNRMTKMELLDTRQIPHEYMCPITHEIMREPVTCSDGYTYEKNAIVEWFMSGKFTSPMTNEILATTDYIYNLRIRNGINEFLEDKGHQ